MQAVPERRKRTVFARSVAVRKTFSIAAAPAIAVFAWSGLRENAASKHARRGGILFGVMEVVVWIFSTTKSTNDTKGGD